MKFDDYFDNKRFLILEEKLTDWNKYISSIPMLKTGVDVLKKIEKIGKENGIKNPKAYIVGGAVRDIIMGDVIPDDIDIATNVPIDILKDHFKTHDIGANEDFGILVIYEDGFEYEIANFRKDGTYSDGRRPDTVEIVDDYKDDASRRDLTINAMAVDADGEIIDYFDGVKDIKNKVIRTVGDAHKRFNEDYIRMLRAIRFGSRLGFDIDPDTMQAIKDNASKIDTQAKERIMKEVLKMAKQSGSKFADAVLTLKDSGLLKYILPEVVEMDEYEHSKEHHPEGNVLQHTLEALRSNDIDDDILNLATLLHDVGKIETHSLDNKGLHRYFGHAKKGAEMIDDIAKRLKMTNKQKDAMKFAAENHMKIHDLLKMKPSKVVKLMDNPNWDILIKVAEADAKARGELFDDKEWDKIIEYVNTIKDQQQAKNKFKKVINGKIVMDTLGVKKGNKHIGDVVKALTDWVVDNNIDITDSELIKNKILELDKEV